MRLTRKISSRFKAFRSEIKSLSRYPALLPIVKTLQNFYLIFRLIYDYRETKKYLDEQWGPGNINFIPLDSCKQIKFPLKEKMFAYNPTLCVGEDKIRFFSRITNVSNKPEVNLLGQLKKRGAISGTINGIVEYELDQDYQVFNYKEVIEPTGVPNLEDPKAFLVENQIALFCNLITKEPNGIDRSFVSKNAILNLDSKIVTALESPNHRNIEKNWIPIDKRDGMLRMFYSCNPLTILHVNLENGKSNMEIIDSKIQIDFHGGSQLIRISEDLLVRVVRRKMQMKNLGMVAISYLMFHNNDLTVHKISKPFIFRKFGFEICNGLAIIENCLVFTWGEDDISSYIGRIKVNKLVEWAF